MSPWQVERTEVLENAAVDETMYHMTLQAPSIAGSAFAGQFVAVRVPGEEALLPRPFDLQFADADAGRIELVYRVKGKGTVALKAVRVGDRLDVHGPFGRSAEPLLQRLQHIAVVGRGAGISPLTFLAHRARGQGLRVSAYLSARTPQLLEPFQRLRDVADVITYNDLERPGAWVTTELERSLAHAGIDAAFVVGSKRLTKATIELARRFSFRPYTFAEPHMGCGFGHCKACAVPMRDGYLLACKEGPLIDLREVSDAYWQSLPV